MSDIKKPYWSVISQQKGADFSLEQNGKEYQCKLVASVFPSSPIAFADTGEVFGEYTLYTATGFLGVLERDIL